MSMTDRFNSREEVPFDEAAFETGRFARRQGIGLESCPFLGFSWLVKSWRAGWADEDQSILTELMIATPGISELPDEAK